MRGKVVVDAVQGGGMGPRAGDLFKEERMMMGRRVDAGWAAANGV